MKALKELVIMIVAIIVFSIDAVFGILYTFFKHALRWDYDVNKQLAPILRAISLAFDGLDNACSGEYYNDKNLKEKGEHPYGKWNETISDITGRNFLLDNLSKKGTRFKKRLDGVFSFFGEKGSHSINAIRKEILNRIVEKK